MMLKAKALVALASFAIAATGQTTTTDTSNPAPTHISQCSTGDVQCCNSVTSAADPAAAALLGPIGVVLQAIDVLVGLGCTPINVVGINNGPKCANQVACCSNNTFNGQVNIGCTPISV